MLNEKLDAPHYVAAFLKRQWVGRKIKSKQSLLRNEKGY
jgi:hypothetical protein